MKHLGADRRIPQPATSLLVVISMGDFMNPCRVSSSTISISLLSICFSALVPPISMLPFELLEHQHGLRTRVTRQRRVLPQLSQSGRRERRVGVSVVSASRAPHHSQSESQPAQLQHQHGCSRLSAHILARLRHVTQGQACMLGLHCCTSAIILHRGAHQPTVLRIAIGHLGSSLAIERG